MNTTINFCTTKQVTFCFDNKKTYSLDVNASITFLYLKRMIAFAAQIPENTFKIIAQGQDFTKINFISLDHYFSNEQSINFKVIID